MFLFHCRTLCQILGLCFTCGTYCFLPVQHYSSFLPLEWKNRRFCFYLALGFEFAEYKRRRTNLGSNGIFTSKMVVIMLNASLKNLLIFSQSQIQCINVPWAALHISNKFDLKLVPAVTFFFSLQLTSIHAVVVKILRPFAWFAYNKKNFSAII